MTPKTMSASSYSTYKTCPLQWKYSYLYKLEQLPNEAFQIGTYYHKCLEDFYKGIEKEVILDDLKKKIIVNKTSEEIKKFGLIRKMFEKYLLNPVVGETLKTEYKFKIQMDNVNVPITGIIDRVIQDGVIDYKTSSFDYELNALDDNIQADIYSYVIWKETGSIPEVIFHVTNKKKIDKNGYVPQIIKVRRTEQELKELESKIFQLIVKIQNNEFNHTPGEHCYWCPFGRKGTQNCNYSL